MKPETKRELINEYKKGRSLKSLGHQYGYAKSTLHYHLNNCGVLRKRKGIKSVVDNALLSGVFVGLWAGDGSKFIDRGVSTIKIHLNKKDKVLIHFINLVSNSLFCKKGRLVEEEKSNRATIIFYSKYLYLWLDNYLKKGKNKALTVELNGPIKNFEMDFILGFLLGITLSDGYIKERFVLNSISRKLVNNVANILRGLGLRPYLSVQNREKYGWFDLNRLQLTKGETQALKGVLNATILRCGLDKDISVLKGYTSQLL